MTDYRDLNVNAAPTNPLITNSEGLQSQVMMTNMGTIIATDIETNTEQIKPCISEDQLYLSNKTFLIFKSGFIFYRNCFLIICKTRMNHCKFFL